MGKQVTAKEKGYKDIQTPEGNVNAARFFGGREREKDSTEHVGGAEITLTAEELEGIVTNAVKAALKAEDDRKRELAKESPGARAAREHCERVNGQDRSQQMPIL